jgi:short-subunit dehydrogenase
MKLRDKRILITGATGGIGQALTRELVAQGACVMLAGRSAAALRALLASLACGSDRVTRVTADLTLAGDRQRLCDAARTWQGGIDMLINNAAISDFALLEDAEAWDIDLAIATNLVAPIELSRRLLPHLRTRAEADIVNIGSVFGHLGFAANSVYCASKFGLRGFSEALRRELADSTVRIRHFAPRATRTAINSAAVNAANAQLGVAMDSPEQVARTLVRWLQTSRSEGVLGWPEKLFARLNAILPRVVDRALRKQLAVIATHAGADAEARRAARTSAAVQTRRIV